MIVEKWTCFDIDDSTSDFLGNLLHVHKSIFGGKHTRNDFANWKIPDDLYKTFKDYEYEIYLTQKILPKVKKKLDDFRKRDYKVMLMTARDETFRKATVFNLAINNIKYDALFFNKNKSLKLNRLMNRFNIEIFADDKLETVNKVAKNTKVKDVYLITRAYNRNLNTESRVKRIYSIDDIKL
jgi:uncharacterized HAD superfamily protein